jgi:hypothetical protein
MRNKQEQIRDFIYGQQIAGVFFNALSYSKGYAVVPRGIEHSHGAMNKTFLKKHYSTDNYETKKNIHIARLEPDGEIISPTSELIKLEIKAADHDSIESFFRPSSFSLQNAQEVIAYYPTTRFIYINIRLKKISGISGLDPMNIDSQRKNWEEPWHWIEGIHTEEQFNHWSEYYIFDPLSLAAEKIVSKFRYCDNLTDLKA